MDVDGVKVNNRGAFDDDDIRTYIKMAAEHSGGAIDAITLIPAEEPGKVKIEYIALFRKFEHILRISGNLVSTIDRNDRLKHMQKRNLLQ